VARVLATVSGTALKPGISRNRRLYTREAIAAAVDRAQEHLAGGGMALTMRSHHAAEDDSTRIVGAVRSLTLAEDGSARFTADIADTGHGRTIAALLDTADGRPPFLSGVSIRGAWDGKVRRERGPDGEPVERGDSLSLMGLDYTASPGVPGAQVDAFTWARDGATETSERVPITESVEEARLTITEDAAPALPGEVREALRALLGEAATVPMSNRDSGLKGGKGVPYADPGYQADGKQRYELDSPAHIRAAWAYISQAGNAKPYSAQQLKRIKGRIKAAAAKAGVKITTEGWVIAPALEVTETLVEYYGGDPERCGSYSLSATNGPTTVTVCSCGVDPEDLHVVLSQACSAASAALCSIDPDMDGDIDIPGADAGDTDGDAGQMDNGDGVEDLVARLRAVIKGESAEDPQALLAAAMNATAVTETATDPAPEPAAANQGTEAPMQETTTTEAAATAPAAPGYTQADLDAAVARGIAQAEEARRARKAAKRATGTPAESAPAGAVAETDEQRIERLVAEKVAALAGPQETEEQRISRLVRERMVTVKQEIAESGGVTRKGLVAEHSQAGRPAGDVPADFPMKDGVMIPMEKWTEAQRQAVGAALQTHVLGDKAAF
jgi:hypothetical protein